MPLFRVTVTQPTEKVIDASNEWMAAIVASDGKIGAQVGEVRPVRGRLPVGTHVIRSNGKRGPGRPPKATDATLTTGGNSNGSSARAVKKVAKKRAPLSPEARAKLAQNLVKARAARAAKAQATKKAAKKATKQTTKTTAKK